MNTQALFCGKTTESPNFGVGRHVSPCSPARSRTSGPPRPPRSRSCSSRIEGADLRGGSQEARGRPRPGPRRPGPEGGKGAASGRTTEGAKRERGGRGPRAGRSTPPRGPPRRTFGEGYSGVLGVDGVEDALVADLRLGDEADLAAQVRGARGAAHGGGRPAGPGPLASARLPRRRRRPLLRLCASLPPPDRPALGPASERRRAAGGSEESAGEEGPQQPHPGPRAATPRPRTLGTHWLSAPASL